MSNTYVEYLYTISKIVNIGLGCTLTIWVEMDDKEEKLVYVIKYKVLFDSFDLLQKYLVFKEVWKCTSACWIL